MARREQLCASFSDEEKAVLEEIATGLGRSVSSVIRDATIRGLPEILEDYKSIKSAIEESKGKNNA
jgi:predicted DNA-binding protein